MSEDQNNKNEKKHHFHFISNLAVNNDEKEERIPVITIDPRSLLEVADKKHRYGKNLRVYFREFNKLSEFQPIHYQSFQEKLESYKPFFSWLDDPNHRIELDECSLQLLDDETVDYLDTEDAREPYKYWINEDGLLEHVKSKQLLTTNPKGEMFVLKDNFFYINEKKTKTIPRFHHSSFFGGDFVNSVGIIICEKGKIKVIFPHSGHYRPLDSHLLWLLQFLQRQTINLRTIQVDAQRVFKVSRHPDKENAPKSKKMDCLYLMDGQTVMDFLRLKFKATNLGLFKEITDFPLKKSTGSPVPQSPFPIPRSSSLQRAQVLENMLCNSNESVAANPSNPLRASHKPSQASFEYTLSYSDDCQQMEQDMRVLLAESPAISNSLSRKVGITQPLSQPSSVEPSTRTNRNTNDLSTKVSSFGCYGGVARCGGNVNLSENGIGESESENCSFEHPKQSNQVVLNNFPEKLTEDDNSRPTAIVFPMLVSNFSRATSTAGLNLLASSPVLN